MASRFRDRHDTDHVPNDHITRWKEKGQDDRQSLLASNCPNWSHVLHVADLRKLDISILERFLHSDVEGEIWNTISE